MKITHRLVATVKRSHKVQWQGQVYRDFQILPEVEAINYALTTLTARDRTTKEIIAEANSYLAALVVP